MTGASRTAASSIAMGRSIVSMGETTLVSPPSAGGGSANADRPAGPYLVGSLRDLSTPLAPLAFFLQPLDLVAERVLGQFRKREPVRWSGKRDDGVARLVHQLLGKMERRPDLGCPSLLGLADFDHLAPLRHMRVNLKPERATRSTTATTLVTAPLQ